MKFHSYPAALKHPNMFQMTQSALQNQLNSLRSVKKGPPPVSPKQEPTNQFQLPQLRPVERTTSDGLSSRPKSMSVSTPNFQVPAPPKLGKDKLDQVPTTPKVPTQVGPARPKSTMLPSPVKGLPGLKRPKQPGTKKPIFPNKAISQ